MRDGQNSLFFFNKKWTSSVLSWTLSFYSVLSSSHTYDHIQRWGYRFWGGPYRFAGFCAQTYPSLLKWSSHVLTVAHIYITYYAAVPCVVFGRIHAAGLFTLAQVLGIFWVMPQGRDANGAGPVRFVLWCIFRPHDQRSGELVVMPLFLVASCY